MEKSEFIVWAAIIILVFAILYLLMNKKDQFSPQIPLEPRPRVGIYRPVHHTYMSGLSTNPKPFPRRGINDMGHTVPHREAFSFKSMMHDLLSNPAPGSYMGTQSSNYH